MKRCKEVTKVLDRWRDLGLYFPDSESFGTGEGSLKYLVLAKNHVPGGTLGAAATPQHFAQRFRTQQQIPGAFTMPFLAFPFLFFIIL